MSAHTAPRRRLVVGGAAALVVLFAVTLRLQPGSTFTMRAIDDVGQSVAALLGAAGCFWRMRRSTGRRRLSWALTGAALACWGAGELVWSYYELIARRETPFPSVADLGYLLFPALALPGLLVRPSAALAGRGWFRVVLDGAMVAASLFNLSWATSLGTVFHSGGQGAFAFGVSLAYPASDLVMLTVAISVLAHARQRTGLPLLVLGLGAMAVADSGFSYLTAVGEYRTGSIVDVAWFAAFLLIGVSAVLSDAEDEVVATRVESPVFVTLPYVLLLVGFVAEGIAFADDRAAPITLVVQAGAIAALLLRQLLTVLDNRRLALDVVSQQAELRFRAFHDALTGLANRALFYDRVAHALELHRRDERPVAVLFCDLDDFKSINDALGHQAGDAVLTAVGERLGRLMRSGDTVARLGGDEFAVLLEDDIDLEALAGRVLHALAEPVEVNGRKVSVRASVGTAVVQPDDVRTGSQELLKRADLAMYAAKRAGKGTSVSFTANLGVRAAARPRRAPRPGRRHPGGPRARGVPADRAHGRAAVRVRGAGPVELPGRRGAPGPVHPAGRPCRAARRPRPARHAPRAAARRDVAGLPRDGLGEHRPDPSAADRSAGPAGRDAGRGRHRARAARHRDPGDPGGRGPAGHGCAGAAARARLQHRRRRLRHRLLEPGPAGHARARHHQARQVAGRPAGRDGRRGPAGVGR